MTPLKRERLLRQIKQLDLMRATGILNVKISMIENGYVKPSSEEREKLAKALRVPVEQLFPEK